MTHKLKKTGRGLTLAMSLVVTQASCTTASTVSSHKTDRQSFVVDNQSYLSEGRDERIKFVVLHYTAETDDLSIYKLTHNQVSAHYLIPSTDDSVIYQLVPDIGRAWHAGRGSFDGRRGLNDVSIGIEVVNLGIQPHHVGVPDPITGYHPPSHFIPFADIQIQKIGQLVQDLSARYNLDPTHIIGHSDMAPNRKIDPGAKFPWERLYREYGVGAWYNEADKQRFMNDGSFENATIYDIKQAFRDYGYDIEMNMEVDGSKVNRDDINVINTDMSKLASEEWDRKGSNVIYAFQLHFRPHNPNGIIDNETYAILQALNLKYR